MAQDASGGKQHVDPTRFVLQRRPKQKKPESCQCPACKGLQCLERPRYFAGQLLTEAELNSEQAYVIAKNRLHNRYLHGWGIVCGLEVTCHNCDGWVKVHAGYALDPCGNDVIVCKDTGFDVLSAIQKCIDAKRHRDDECAPWRDPNDDCQEEEQHWCITLQYVENEGRGVMPLQEPKSHCGCGSKCGGGCECGGSSKKSGGCSCGGEKSKPSSAKKVSCEPTRVFEQYRLGVVPEPDECRSRRQRDVKMNEMVVQQRHSASLVSELLPKELTGNRFFQLLAATAPDHSIFARALYSISEVVARFQERFTAEEQMALFFTFRRCHAVRDHDEDTTRTTSNNLNGNEATSTPTQTEAATQNPMHDLCCKLRRFVRDLFASNPMNVRCSFDCPPCDPNGGGTTMQNPNGSTSTSSPFDAICCLIDALIAYIVDGICALFLPPCPPQPCDDRVILACVTIRNKKIVHICNHACRHYAGSFNSVQHWLSAVPVIPLLGTILREVCCSDDPVEVLSQLKRLFDDDKQKLSDVEKG